MGRATAPSLRFLAASALLVQLPSSPQDTPAPDKEVVVTAYPPHCKALANDPADAATAAAPTQSWYWLVPEGDGWRYERREGDRTQPPPAAVMTTLGQWRRAGDGLPSFVFRQPSDGTPLCVGRRAHSPSGTVNLQQILPVGPYVCKFVRLTLFAASRKAVGGFWLNSSSGGFVGHDFSGNHGWTPVRIEQGPVEAQNKWIGFGLGLQDGDTWLYKVDFAVIADSELTPEDRRHQRECLVRRDRLKRYYRDNPGAPRPAVNGIGA